MNDWENEIVEIDSSNEEEKKEVVNIEPVFPNNKPKKTLKDKWNELNKNTKVAIIVGSIVVLLLIITIIIYFVFFNKPNDDNPDNEDFEKVVIAKDNYRYENGRLVFLDKVDRVLGGYDCENQDPDKCLVPKLDFSEDQFERIISVDEKGEEIPSNSAIYYDRYVFVQDGDNIFLYDILNKGKNYNLTSIKAYGTSDNLVVIANNNSKYGLIQIKENEIKELIPCEYDNLGIINPKLAYLIATSKDQTFIINQDNTKLTSNIRGNVASANDKYFVINNNNKYSLYTLGYEEVYSDYDYIGLHDNVISLVLNNRLYLVDNNLNKLFEEGLRLENKNYVKKYVYDANNKLKETLKSFEIENKNNHVIVTIGNTVKDINTLEGVISSTYKYLSYYDGTLYIYKDEAKKEVLGTYTCENKNTLDNTSSEFTNCVIYNDDNGTSGIYNSEFIFVIDGATSNKLIYLYDLVNKKNLGTYSEIKMLNEREISENIMPITTSSSYILAKSAKGANMGNYGILSIADNKATGKIGFQYASIMAYNDYYLLKNVDNTSIIYSHDFEEKVSDSLDYIEMYDNYYIGVNKGILNIYNYDNKKGILSKGLEVSNNNFKVEFANGITITVDGVTYNYDLDGNEVVDDSKEEETEPNEE